MTLIKKTVFSVLIGTAFVVTLLLAGCGGTDEVSTEKLGLIEDDEFGGVYLDITNDELFACGFNLGDSVDVVFTNGNTFEDIPIYDGYYGKTGDLIVCCYPTYDHVAVSLCQGSGVMELSGTTLDDTATVKLREAGKYQNVQEALGMTYSNDREEYDSDVAFTNFRELSGGKLVSGRFYRGATPFDSKNNRPEYVQPLLEKNGINFIFNMSDDEEKYNEHLQETELSEYTETLVKEGKVAFLGMTAAYQTEESHQKIVQGVLEMMENDGPYYIHCTEGKDRTGFACVLFESLAGATYEEMKKDYMKSYENYYGITKEDNRKSYNAIVNVKFNDFLFFLHETDDPETLKNADFTQDARNYLIQGGMTDAQVDEFEAILTEEIR